MRAKRSKKYRKLMHQYETTFGFREPYQVLVDSHFLQSVYAFKMDLLPALERTVQGKVKPFITKCSLAAVMAASTSSSHSSSSTPQSRPPPQRRPAQLPPPTVLPLRYCSHNEDDTPIDETACLLSLLSPSQDSKKNKEHYILASADPVPPREDGKRKSTKPPPRYNLRRDARLIPGVPIIYVKRSVMILEPMSGSSEGVRDGVERGKFKTGLVSTVAKRKREDDGDTETKPKKAKKVKGPNPLSVKKPKKREDPASQEKMEKESPEKAVAPVKGVDNDHSDNDHAAPTKTKRKRKHKHKPLQEGEIKPGVLIAAET
ncbi:predicted protein [Uncinocarpus reesii 1704]|uniref:UTP23 sensor motif region domain-containing protein n=1 Tax=Uncinocarpus reesii (strain UAMH 1704) TaxID=336963 RepID=C4JW32_UNCRE|nr:uncharacterized protein UREG_06774 [Uncinocarpus reesii 1704]EEP81909.1 predicted protein [Uncinocarpus reesii 1704]